MNQLTFPQSPNALTTKKIRKRMNVEPLTWQKINPQIIRVCEVRRRSCDEIAYRQVPFRKNGSYKYHWCCDKCSQKLAKDVSEYLSITPTKKMPFFVY